MADIARKNLKRLVQEMDIILYENEILNKI